jgi:hypothetical protein
MARSDRDAIFREIIYKFVNHHNTATSSIEQLGEHDASVIFSRPPWVERTLLHLALTYNQDPAVIIALIRKGASLHVPDSIGHTPAQLMAGNARYIPLLAGYVNINQYREQILNADEEAQRCAFDHGLYLDKFKRLNKIRLLVGFGFTEDCIRLLQWE